MHKALAILFLTTHLLGNTEFGQIARIPRLFSHYQQHCEQEAIGFLTFIAMHYGGNDGTSADDHEDSQLPCQTTTGDHSYLHALIPGVQAVSGQTAPHYPSPRLSMLWMPSDLLSGFVNRILQPPRV